MDQPKTQNGIDIMALSGMKQDGMERMKAEQKRMEGRKKTEVGECNKTNNRCHICDLF